MFLINNSDDVNKIKNTKYYDKLLEYVKSNYEYQLDVQDYPEDYHSEDYSGPTLDPIMKTFYRDELLTQYGFTLKDIGR